MVRAKLFWQISIHQFDWHCRSLFGLFFS